LENLLATIGFANVLNDVLSVGTINGEHLRNFFFVVDFLHEFRINGFFKLFQPRAGLVSENA
jgi:hypothetical protein